MYVEDEVLIARSVVTMLESKIKDVYVALNGEAGLEIFKKHRPQIVVTDIKMPVMDGLEMIEKIKGIEHATKFIVVSAYGETNYFIRAIELSVHGFILKPVDLNQLMEIIMELSNSLILQQKIQSKEEERKKAESARLTLEKQYAELHENMRDGSVRADLDGKIQNFNIAFQKMLGYSEEELYGKTTRDITPKKWHSFETDTVETQVKTNGYSELYEKEYIHRDGRIIPIECRTYLQKDENDEMVGYWGIVRDITSRKQSEEALKESEEQYRDLFENANDLIWLSDLDGKYVMVNRLFEDLLGYTKEELEKPRESVFGATNGDLKRGLEFGLEEYKEIDDQESDEILPPTEEASLDFEDGKSSPKEVDDWSSEEPTLEELEKEHYSPSEQEKISEQDINLEIPILIQDTSDEIKRERIPHEEAKRQNICVTERSISGNENHGRP